MKIKTLGVLIGILGLFVAVGSASASTADTLQPASVITYDDELVVNNTGRFNSAYIGSTEAGVGGVTFFNGTIVNLSVDEDGEDTIPVTFGDDVRIDGRIWRGETAGAGLDDNRELTVNDDMIVTGSLEVDNLIGTGVVNSTNVLDGTITTADLADDIITSAKISDGTITGSDISSSADLNVNTITATGDITQGLSDNGTVKAMIYVPADGDCTASDSRQWTYDDSSVTCSKFVGGDDTTIYTMTFDFDISNRFWQVTPAPNVTAGDDYSPAFYSLPNPSNSKQILVSLFTEADESVVYGSTSFMLTVY